MTTSGKALRMARLFRKQSGRMFGRNVFQRPDAAKTLRALAGVVHEQGAPGKLTPGGLRIPFAPVKA